MRVGYVDQTSYSLVLVCGGLSGYLKRLSGQRCFVKGISILSNFVDQVDGAVVFSFLVSPNLAGTWQVTIEFPFTIRKVPFMSEIDR